MATADRPASSRGSPGFDLLIALLVTGYVYLDFWNGRLPESPSTTVLALSIAGGALAGGASIYLDRLPQLREYVENTAIFLLLVGVALLVGFLLFPGGLPVWAEIGLVAFAWGAFVARVFVRSH